MASDQILRQIKARLSLRQPQADSLDILADIVEHSPLTDLVPFQNSTDPAEMLTATRDRYPGVTDFERDFSSLCFALATGVGKTRLMGAFISYLYLSGRSKHFFVLAPNTTIYDKLIADFTPGTEKYVFKGIAEFAQIPLLNESQLVARWKLITPPAIVSETQQLPIDGLAAGVYLIEATDGTYKAYTVAVVTSIAVVERSSGNQVSLYVADRKTGAPMGSADVALWAGGSLQSSGKTGTDGLASLTMNARGAAQGAEPENVLILAQHGADAALVTPWSYGFSGDTSSPVRAYVYTDRPVYRPGHTVHIKAIVRK